MSTLNNKTAETNTTVTVMPRPVWPLPKLNGAKPVLLVENPSDPGVQLAYEYRDGPEGPMVHSTQRTSFQPFYLPPLTPVYAVFDGRIMYAGRHADGHTIIVEHPNGWMTFYSHLEQMFVFATDRRHRCQPQYVKAGHVLGYAGKRDGSLRTIRFELWKLDEHCGYVSIDPIRFMRRWRMVPWLDAKARDSPADTEPRAA